MAKKKDSKPPIVNGLKEEYIVTKSRPLILMKEVPFALGELKVLDTYLSRINAKDPEATTVRFSKEEYEDLMGIERMRPERLSKYVDSLMGKVVTVPEQGARGGWKKYTLFSTCECSQDENEQWWIDLSCTTEAKKLFFNVERIGYTRYQLKNVLPMTSKYSVLLYIYLLDNRFRASWAIPLEELREKVFRCTSDSYKDFKYFKRDILDKALKEVNIKSDLTFEYETVKIGRKVSKIKFTLIKDEVTLPLEQEPNQMGLEDYIDGDGFFVDEENPNQIYADALPPDLTAEEVETLRALVFHHNRVEYDPFGPLPIECLAANYLQRMTNLMKAQRRPVRDKFAWLRHAIIEDWK